MNTRKREERNRTLFLFRNGLGHTQKHTLFETALKFDLSVNQIFRIERQFASSLIDFAQRNGIESTSGEYKLSEPEIEWIIKKYSSINSETDENEGATV